MDDLLRLLLTNAGSAFLIALLAWVASRTTRRQAVVHGLWLLALVRLVTPPIAPVPLVPAWPGLALVSPASTPTVVSIPPGAPEGILDQPRRRRGSPRRGPRLPSSNPPPTSRSVLSPHRPAGPILPPRSPSTAAGLARGRVAVARGRRPRDHAAHGLAVQRGSPACSPARSPRPTRSRSARPPSPPGWGCAASRRSSWCRPASRRCSGRIAPGRACCCPRAFSPTCTPTSSTRSSRTSSPTSAAATTGCASSRSPPPPSSGGTR